TLPCAGRAAAAPRVPSPAPGGGAIDGQIQPALPRETPPPTVPASRTSTSAPPRASSHAHASPTTPPPTTATFIARTPYARCMAFSDDERERAARYHRPLYWAALTRLLLVAAVYAVCTTVDTEPFGWAGAAALWATFVTMAATLVCLPLDLWRGYIRERRWGFSTQSLRGWLGDRAKGLAVGIALSV